MSVLDRVNGPADLKNLSPAELDELCNDIRTALIETTRSNGGHLASSLGAVEMTVALHRVFNSPEDKIIWDVGHQAYAHKLLTGRRDSFISIRKFRGLSGFPVRGESPHDAFGAGHAGTSVSAALGMALARDLKNEDYQVLAVIGDGSLGAGMAFEAVNHAGNMKSKVIVILNDNGISISPTVGAMARRLNRVRFSAGYEKTKRNARRTLSRLPLGVSAWTVTKWIKRRAERALLYKSYWTEMGFVYLGPVDGHDIAEMERAMVRARDFESGPVLIHLITQKGRGHQPAEADPTKFHGVSPNAIKKAATPSYSQVFGSTLADIMRSDKRVVAITAAMLDGTGIAELAKEFPDRVFDVGICEQHAVTLAAGLAAQGMVPVVAIYSTFLQRAYDQVIHDVCLQDLPVVFAIDRAGLVGDDGKTHQGTLDISYLRLIPNMVVAAPKDEDELRSMLHLAVESGRPFAVRYPRGAGYGLEPTGKNGLSPGRGEILRRGGDLAILAIGSTVYPALEAAELLAAKRLDCTVANARFAKPLDTGLIDELLGSHRGLVTVEENTICGGFGSAVLEYLSAAGRNKGNIACIALPDSFIEHGSQEILRNKFQLDAEGIADRVLDIAPRFVEGEFHGISNR
jgi:1-deoxy-D-xylulose-5-phosphate synthase